MWTKLWFECEWKYINPHTCLITNRNWNSVVIRNYNDTLGCIVYHSHCNLIWMQLFIFYIWIGFLSGNEHKSIPQMWHTIHSFVLFKYFIFRVRNIIGNQGINITCVCPFAAHYWHSFDKPLYYISKDVCRLISHWTYMLLDITMGVRCRGCIPIY